MLRSLAQASHGIAFRRLVHAFWRDTHSFHSVIWERGNLHLDNRSFILHPFKFARSGYLLHHIKLTCILAGFFERIHENRKKYTKSESKPNCYHHSSCRTETNKPRPNAVLIVRRDFIAAESHGSELPNQYREEETL